MKGIQPIPKLNLKSSVVEKSRTINDSDIPSSLRDMMNMSKEFDIFEDVLKNDKTNSRAILRKVATSKPPINNQNNLFTASTQHYQLQQNSQQQTDSSAASFDMFNKSLIRQKNASIVESETSTNSFVKRERKTTTKTTTKITTILNNGKEKKRKIETITKEIITTYGPDSVNSSSQKEPTTTMRNKAVRKSTEIEYDQNSEISISSDSSFDSVKKRHYAVLKTSKNSQKIMKKVDKRIQADLEMGAGGIDERLITSAGKAVKVSLSEMDTNEKLKDQERRQKFDILSLSSYEDRSSILTKIREDPNEELTVTADENQERCLAVQKMSPLPSPGPQLYESKNSENLDFTQHFNPEASRQDSGGPGDASGSNDSSNSYILATEKGILTEDQNSKNLLKKVLRDAESAQDLLNRYKKGLEASGVDLGPQKSFKIDEKNLANLVKKFDAMKAVDTFSEAPGVKTVQTTTQLFPSFSISPINQLAQKAPSDHLHNSRQVLGVDESVCSNGHNVLIHQYVKNFKKKGKESNTQENSKNRFSRKGSPKRWKPRAGNKSVDKENINQEKKLGRRIPKLLTRSSNYEFCLREISLNTPIDKTQLSDPARGVEKPKSSKPLKELKEAVFQQNDATKIMRSLDSLGGSGTDTPNALGGPGEASTARNVAKEVLKKNGQKHKKINIKRKMDIKKIQINDRKVRLSPKRVPGGAKRMKISRKKEERENRKNSNSCILEINSVIKSMQDNQGGLYGTVDVLGGNSGVKKCQKIGKIQNFSQAQKDLLRVSRMDRTCSRADRFELVRPLSLERPKSHPKKSKSRKISQFQNGQKMGLKGVRGFRKTNNLESLRKQRNFITKNRNFLVNRVNSPQPPKLDLDGFSDGKAVDETIPAPTEETFNTEDQEKLERIEENLKNLKMQKMTDSHIITQDSFLRTSFSNPESSNVPRNLPQGPKTSKIELKNHIEKLGFETKNQMKDNLKRYFNDFVKAKGREGSRREDLRLNLSAKYKNQKNNNMPEIQFYDQDQLNNGIDGSEVASGHQNRAGLGLKHCRSRSFDGQNFNKNSAFQNNSGSIGGHKRRRKRWSGVRSTSSRPLSSKNQRKPPQSKKLHLSQKKLPGSSGALGSSHERPLDFLEGIFKLRLQSRSNIKQRRISSKSGFSSSTGLQKKESRAKRSSKMLKNPSNDPVFGRKSQKKLKKISKKSYKEKRSTGSESRSETPGYPLIDTSPSSSRAACFRTSSSAFKDFRKKSKKSPKKAKSRCFYGSRKTLRAKYATLECPKVEKCLKKRLKRKPPKSIKRQNFIGYHSTSRLLRTGCEALILPDCETAIQGSYTAESAEKSSKSKNSNSENSGQNKTEKTDTERTELTTESSKRIAYENYDSFFEYQPRKLRKPREKADLEITRFGAFRKKKRSRKLRKHRRGSEATKKHAGSHTKGPEESPRQLQKLRFQQHQKGLRYQSGLIRPKKGATGACITSGFAPFGCEGFYRTVVGAGTGTTEYSLPVILCDPEEHGEVDENYKMHLLDLEGLEGTDSPTNVIIHEKQIFSPNDALESSREGHGALESPKGLEGAVEVSKKRSMKDAGNLLVGEYGYRKKTIGRGLGSRKGRHQSQNHLFSSLKQSEKSKAILPANSEPSKAYTAAAERSREQSSGPSTSKQSKNSKIEKSAKNGDFGDLGKPSPKKQLSKKFLKTAEHGSATFFLKKSQDAAKKNRLRNMLQSHLWQYKKRVGGFSRGSGVAPHSQNTQNSLLNSASKYESNFQNRTNSASDASYSFLRGESRLAGQARRPKKTVFSKWGGFKKQNLRSQHFEEYFENEKKRFKRMQKSATKSGVLFRNMQRAVKRLKNVEKVNCKNDESLSSQMIKSVHKSSKKLKTEDGDEKKRLLITPSMIYHYKSRNQAHPKLIVKDKRKPSTGKEAPPGGRKRHHGKRPAKKKRDKTSKNKLLNQTTSTTKQVYRAINKARNGKRVATSAGSEGPDRFPTDSIASGALDPNLEIEAALINKRPKDNKNFSLTANLGPGATKTEDGRQTDFTFETLKQNINFYLSDKNYALPRKHEVGADVSDGSIMVKSSSLTPGVGREPCSMIEEV